MAPLTPNTQGDPNYDGGFATTGPFISYSNTNGAYTANQGYNLCTGLGRPDIAGLIKALASTLTVLPTVSIGPNYLGGSITVMKPWGFTAIQ